jgi:hypothetical protein
MVWHLHAVDAVLLKPLDSLSLSHDGGIESVLGNYNQLLVGR